MPTKPSNESKSKSTAPKKIIGEDKPQRDDRAAPAKTKVIGEDKPQRDDRVVASKSPASQATTVTKKPKSPAASDERTYTPASKKKR